MLLQQQQSNERGENCQAPSQFAQRKQSRRRVKFTSAEMMFN